MISENKTAEKWAFLSFNKKIHFVSKGKIMFKIQASHLILLSSLLTITKPKTALATIAKKVRL